MTENETNRPSPLDEAIATCQRHGYHVERAEVFRKRENRLQERAAGTQTQNREGVWVPAIPEPLFLAFGRVRCNCGETMRGRRRYREHFALTHVLGLDA